MTQIILILLLPIRLSSSLGNWQKTGNPSAWGDPQATINVTCNTTMADLYPQSDDRLFSCQGRCGSGPDLPCSCDASCFTYKDCCSDFHDICRDLSTSSSKLELFENNTDDTSTRITRKPSMYDELPFAKCGRFYTRLVSSCPEKNDRSSLLEERCLEDDLTKMSSLYSLFPVTDRTTGILFKNIYCLICNGGNAGKAITWALKIKPRQRSRGFDVQSIEDIMAEAKGNNTDIFAVPPKGIKQRFCIPDYVWSAISPPCQCSKLQKLCATEDGYIIDTISQQLFRNPHCVICYHASTNVSAFSPAVLGLISAIIHTRKPYTFPFDILMNLNIKASDSGGKKFSELALFSGIQVRADKFIPWKRMKCEIGEEINNGKHIPQKVATAKKNAHACKGQNLENAVDCTPNISSVIPNPSKFSVALGGEDAVFIKGIDGISHIDTNDKSNTPPNVGVKELTLSQLHCRKTVCSPGVHYHNGECVETVLGTKVYLSYAEDNRFLKRVQGDLVPDLKKRVEDGILMSINETATLLTLTDLHDADNGTMELYLYNDSGMPSNSEWYQNRGAMSKRQANATFHYLRAILDHMGVEERLLHMCVIPFCGEFREAHRNNCQFTLEPAPEGTPNHSSSMEGVSGSGWQLPNKTWWWIWCLPLTVSRFLHLP